MYDEFHIYFPDGEISLEKFMEASSFSNFILKSTKCMILNPILVKSINLREKPSMSPNNIFIIITIMITQEKKDVDTSMRLNSLLLKNDLLSESLFHVFDQVTSTATWYLVSVDT